MIDLIAAAGVGGIIGFGTCAVLTAARFGDLADTEAESSMWENAWQHAIASAVAANNKLDAIRDLLDTPRTIRKGEVALILDGEQA